MPNPAKTDFAIHPLLQTRYSPRAFLDKPVPEDVLRRMFEAARWSPSCNNDQEWFYIVGRRNQGPDFDKVCSVLKEGNRRWACKAAVLAIICGRTTFGTGTAQNKWHAYDCGQSAAHLTFQAAAEGIMVHQMAGFEPEKSITEFSIPQGFVPLTAVAMGYAGDASLLPADIAAREVAERTRRPQSQFVFGADWGKPLFNA
jgi:nitroreductase